MHLPLDLDPGPYGAGAASRNCAFWLLLATLPAACGTPAPETNGSETVVGADQGMWERSPVGARVRLDGILSGEFQNGARVELTPRLCAHLAMSRQEWDGLMQTAGAGRRVTVYGSKAADSGGCLFQLNRVGIVAR